MQIKWVYEDSYKIGYFSRTSLPGESEGANLGGSQSMLGDSSFEVVTTEDALVAVAGCIRAGFLLSTVQTFIYYNVSVIKRLLGSS